MNEEMLTEIQEMVLGLIEKLNVQQVRFQRDIIFNG